MPTRIARGTRGLVSMIEEVARIAQEWGGIRKTRPASHGRTRCGAGAESRGPECQIRERLPKSCFQPAVPLSCKVVDRFARPQTWPDASSFTTAAASTGGTGSPHSGSSAQIPNEGLSSIRQSWRSTLQLLVKASRWLELLLHRLT